MRATAHFPFCARENVIGDPRFAGFRGTGRTHRPTRNHHVGPPWGKSLSPARNRLRAMCLRGSRVPPLRKTLVGSNGENRVRDFLKKKKSPGRGRCPRKSLDFTLVTTARVSGYKNDIKIGYFDNPRAKARCAPHPCSPSATTTTINFTTARFSAT